MSLAQFNYGPMVRAFEKNRQGWLDILVDNPDRLDAAQMIVDINCKLQFIRGLKPTDYDEDSETVCLANEVIAAVQERLS